MKPETARITIRERGFTILELMIAVSVMSLFFVALATSNRYEDRKRIGQTLGESYKPMAQALQDYIQEHRLKLVQGLPVTGVSNAFQPTIAELRTLNFYSTNFPLTIPSNGGTPTFRIARIPTGCVTTACDLEYFVGNTIPELSNDGTPNEGILAAAAATIGATAGYSTSLAPSTIAGRGGWTYTNPNGAVGGIFGIYTTYSQSGNAAFVRIQDMRDPDLQGALSVVGTTKAGKLQVSDTVTLGAACTPNGLISKDSAGVILSCQSGVWSRYVNAAGDTMSGRLSVATNDYGVVLWGAGGSANAAPQSGIGSGYVNDIYIRSIGKWASQLYAGSFVTYQPTGACVWPNSVTGACSCPSGTAAYQVGQLFIWAPWDGNGWMCH